MNPEPALGFLGPATICPQGSRPVGLIPGLSSTSPLGMRAWDSGPGLVVCNSQARPSAEMQTARPRPSPLLPRPQDCLSILTNNPGRDAGPRAVQDCQAFWSLSAAVGGALGLGRAASQLRKNHGSRGVPLGPSHRPGTAVQRLTARFRPVNYDLFSQFSSL